MKKTSKTMIIVAVVVAVLAGGVVAFAADSVSDLENARLAYHTELNKDLVASGKMTQQEADAFLANATARFARFNDGSGQERFAYGNKTDRGQAYGLGNMGKETDGMIADYAKLVGKDASEVLEVLNKADQNIWQLAEQEGKFAELKALMLADIDAYIAKFDGDDVRLEALQAHRDEIAAMSSAADAHMNPASMGNRGARGASAQDFTQGRQDGLRR